MSLLLALLIFGLIVFVGAGFLLFGIVVVFKLADHVAVRIQHKAYQWFPGLQPAPPPKPVLAGSPLLGIGTCLLPSTIVLAVFVVLSGAAEREWIRWKEWRSQSPSNLSTTVMRAKSADQQVSALTVKRPDWITASDSNFGEVQQKVLASQLWSSSAEAEQDLQNQAVELVSTDFQKRHTGFLDPQGDRFLQKNKIANAITKARHVEKIDHNFGKFTAPMYRAWWKVEISPQIRTEFYPDWKSAALQNRIIVLGFGIAIATLFASAIDFFVKLRQTIDRGLIRRIAVCVTPVLSWFVMELLVAMHLMS